jgi:hypothetical protein
LDPELLLDQSPEHPLLENQRILDATEDTRDGSIAIPSLSAQGTRRPNTGSQHGKRYSG